MDNNYKKIKLKFFTEGNIEKISYLFFGVLTTIINIVVFWIMNSPLKINFMVANVIAWIISAIFAFITNKIFVFKSSTTKFIDLTKEAFSFFFFRVVTLFQDEITMIILVQFLGINGVIAKVISNIFVVISNYFASKLVIFRKKAD
jgi:putative flippase GtrA